MQLDKTLGLFELHNSVFQEWRMDTRDTIDKCLERDFAFWKMNRQIKDTKDLDAVKQFFKDNFAVLKEIRIGVIAKSGDPPQLNFRMFTEMCKKANIYDKQLN